MFDRSFFSQLQLASPYRVEGHDEHFIITCADDPKGHVEFYYLEHGCFLAIYRVRGAIWPSFHVPGADRLPPLLFVNICLKGRCDLTLSDNAYVSLSDHRVAATMHLPKTTFAFPTSYYDGIGFFIMPSMLDTSPSSFLSMCDIDFDAFIKRFHCDQHLYFQFADAEIYALADKLKDAAGSESSGFRRLLSALLIKELMQLPEKSSHVTLLAKSQMAIVNACEALLCEDLSRRFTLTDLADRFNINENTLKAYFKQAHGVSITEYMTHKRIEKAKALLSESHHKISDIAMMVGYEHAGKFSAIFRRECGLTPSSYRIEATLRRLNI